MMSKKENLIKALHGSIQMMKDVQPLIGEVDVFNEEGYVDLDFFTKALTAVNDFMDISNQLVQHLSMMLAPNAVEDSKAKKADNGKNMSAEDILKLCTLTDNILRLPNIQFNAKTYQKVKQYIMEAGGKWEGGKTQGFTFPFNANRVFSILKEGKRCNLQQDFQFFATPAAVADKLVELAGPIEPTDTILEPSAGTGALIDAIHRHCDNIVIDCFELMPENKEQLSKKDNIRILGDDFTKTDCGTYSKIIANPPFANNQDVDHVLAMYDVLEPGGTLGVITSKHWEIASEKKCCDFRQWLEDVNAEQYDVSEGEFKESGTGIGTKILIIHKSSKSSTFPKIKYKQLDLFA